MSFCLYISARVFVQYLKSRPDDSTVYSSLQFVISALNAIKSKNPLTESFLVQLDVDLEGTGIRALDHSKSGSGLSHVAQALVRPLNPLKPRVFFSQTLKSFRGSNSNLAVLLL